MIRYGFLLYDVQYENHLNDWIFFSGMVLLKVKHKTNYIYWYFCSGMVSTTRRGSSRWSTTRPTHKRSIWKNVHPTQDKMNFLWQFDIFRVSTPRATMCQRGDTKESQNHFLFSTKMPCDQFCIISKFTFPMKTHCISDTMYHTFFPWNKFDPV